MRRIIIAFGSAAFALVAPAQQALQCVNPDVLNSLVFNARAESRLSISRGMPDNVAGFRAPAGFSLIGSGTRGPEFPSTMVAYKTTMARDKAFDSLRVFLAGEGWNSESSAQTVQAPVIVAAPQPTAATLCRNGDRRVVQVQDIEGIRYATITAVPPVAPRACGAPDPMQGFSGGGPAARDAARAIMPQFSFPQTARMNAGTPSAMNNGGDISSSVRIDSPDTAAALAGNLAHQLKEQGWRGDAEWNGKLSTGSTWMRRNDAGQVYWGTLEVLNRGSGVYDVGFSVATGRQ